jgi:metallo-beta-lactamase class B
MDVTENGRLYHVLIANLPSMNEGVNFVGNKMYPNIVDDYVHTFEVLKSLPCDVFLSSHTTQFRFNSKFHQDQPYSPERYVDPVGYQLEVQKLEDRFYKEVQEQREEDKNMHDHLNFKDLPITPPQ